MAYRPIEHYLILTDVGPSGLQKQVREMIARDWQPLGGAQPFSDIDKNGETVTKVMQTVVYRTIPKQFKPKGAA